MSATLSTFEMGSGGAGAPKTLRLTSQVVYKRPVRDAASALTTLSTYDASVGAIRHDQAQALCVDSRKTVALNDMVHRAASSVPLEHVYGPPAHETAFDAAGATRRPASVAPSLSATDATGPLGAEGSTADGGMLSTADRFKVKEPTRSGVLGPYSMESPAEKAAFATLCGVLEKDARHGIRGAMAKEFFGAGSADGPFPGSRSQNGEWMAATYYAHARPLGGAFATGHTDHYSESGYKLAK